MPTLLTNAFATTLILLVLCVVFAVEVACAATGDEAMLFRLGALPDSGGLQGQYWRLLTSGLLHWNFLHLALNGSALFFTGAILERRTKSWTLPVLFLTSSVVSGMAILIKHHFLPQPGVTVGASGGVFGFLGAAIVLIQRVPPLRPATRWWLWLVFFAGVAISLVPGVSMVGHIAGFLVGIPAGYLVLTKAAATSTVSAPDESLERGLGP